MDNLVNILIVTYNSEKYIKKTINSCLNQTYKNIEILLLDNASEDKTVEIVKNIQLKNSRLKIFESKDNLGPYGGLNFLLEKSNGEYISIQDHDDIWFPEKIEKQVKLLEENRDFIACGTNTFYYFESKKLLILNKKDFNSNFVGHTSLMFRNKKFRYNKHNSLPDLHFEKKILAKAGRIFCLCEPLVVHRIRNDENNFSLKRFKFNFKSIIDYFLLSTNIFDLMNFLLAGYFPESILWAIRKKITLRKAIWMEKDKFIDQYKIEI